jgi:hypothetical protein
VRRALPLLVALATALPAPAQPIDRQALVGRHAIELTRPDAHAPLMLGNGELGFTADITGLQTFPELYSPIAPLLTMAQWAWHSFPNPKRYSEADGLVQVPVPGRGRQPYPWIRDWAELETRPALRWLRENPHRFSLGRIGLALVRADGGRAAFGDLSATRQRLDLWTGTLTSSFVFDGAPVRVETRVAGERDAVVVTIRSPLVASGRLGVDVAFPGVAAKLNPDPSDWTAAARHRTTVLVSRSDRMLVERQIDATRSFASVVAPGAAVRKAGAHRVSVRGTGDTLSVLVSFDRQRPRLASLDPGASARLAEQGWRSFWSDGGAVDFSGSSDPRAAELERRVVLSQYLARINAAGSLPPQEEGLFSNSWNGKFHLEMHPIHAAHWATWGRPALLERSLGWYLRMLPTAMAVARRHGVQGAWWPKMVGPEGRNSPSTVNPFIMWQQPHPIYMAELVWRARGDPATLARYGDMVEQTARLLASWPRKDGARFVLGPPIIPVQENHPALSTVNPAFEVEYFRWGLETAQRWRERRGLKRVAQWDAVIAGLPAPAVREGLYLPTETDPTFWNRAASADCKRMAVEAKCLNRDHPSFLMALGFIRGARTDPQTMRATLAATERNWDRRQTWGWDFPFVAMTAAQLGEPARALDWLFNDLPNNRFGTSGMTPRVHLEAERQLVGPAAAAGSIGPDGPGFARAAETYFPSNGALLLAVGMMAAGWDGAQGPAPGFPKQGWRVRVEGVRPLP